MISFPLRTLVDIPRADLGSRDRLARHRKESRAALIRAAVRQYLADNSADRLREAFGLWRDGEDGLAHQARMRAEWPD
ncbi:ribbon-helix-helix protein, CopG family [Hankyongella ginsenosidimutans]|uniref:ribbon-helix-helix protein, CopG family n=1 Tax=Hankyongella ginsenosidimutans TaxID=1763828 RepID=UPI001CA34428|nr:ribbon-helix-helix protein, CopG family [Hankyongella ginsenosidimutans]